MLPKPSRIYKIWFINLYKLCEICQKFPCIARSFKILPKVATSCQKLPKSCQNMHKDAKRCQKMTMPMINDDVVQDEQADTDDLYDATQD